MSEKTEQPTPKRLRDARKKGQVAKSKEVVSTFVFAGVLATVWLPAKFYFEQIKAMFFLPIRFFDAPFEDALQSVLQGTLKTFLLVSLPIVLAGMIFAVVSHFFQFGILLSAKPVTPDLKKINPGEGIKKIFSMNNLVECLKSVIKIVVLGYLMYVLIKDSIDPLVKIPYMGIAGMLEIGAALLLRLVGVTLTTFIVIACFDFAYQRWQHTNKLKMTKDEVKREYKESEGDPQIKGQRKQLHQEIIMLDMMENVRKSSVVVTNPTRIAIALRYEKGKTPLPVVAAKGENLLAKRIIQVAQEAGVPIMQNVPLARDLLEQGKLNEYIPAELIEPVAEVLRWARDLIEED